MKIKKQHVLVAALILALGAAVYLNWQFSGTPLISLTSKELGAATYVSNEAKATVDEVQTSGSVDDSPESVIAKARNERSQVQDKALEEAKNVLELSDTSEEAKAEAVKTASAIEDRILAQSNVENILAAKGFPNTICFVSDAGCTVTVPSADMKDDSAIIIKDAVLSQIDVTFSNIVIVEI